MHSSSNRSVLIISGLLTLLVLSGGALALGFHNDWLRSGSGAASPEAIGADSQPRRCQKLTGRSDWDQAVGRGFDTNGDSGRGRRLPAEARGGIPSPR